MMMLVDDVGSFPLLEGHTQQFHEQYLKAYRVVVERGIDELLAHRGLRAAVYEPIVRSFMMKLQSGLDVINYPQHYSFHGQFMRPVMNYPASDQSEPFLIDAAKATILEMQMIRHHVESTPVEKLGIPEQSASREKVLLKACITGPIELYIKSELGFTVYKDLLRNFARSVNAFARSAVIDSDRVATRVIAIDEPSLGFIELFNVEENDLVDCLDTALEGLPDDVITQVHLHSLRDAGIALKSKNIDVLTCEYASDQSNIISRSLLERHGKKMRVGICRTNYNAIIGKLMEDGGRVGTAYEDQVQLVDSEARIEETFRKAIAHYGGENIAFAGPDCGLSSWSPPELAQLLLKRATSVARRVLDE